MSEFTYTTSMVADAMLAIHSEDMLIHDNSPGRRLGTRPASMDWVEQVADVKRAWRSMNLSDETRQAMFWEYVLVAMNYVSPSECERALGKTADEVHELAVAGALSIAYRLNHGNK